MEKWVTRFREIKQEYAKLRIDPFPLASPDCHNSRTDPFTALVSQMESVCAIELTPNISVHVPEVEHHGLSPYQTTQISGGVQPNLRLNPAIMRA